MGSHDDGLSRGNVPLHLFGGELTHGNENIGVLSGVTHGAFEKLNLALLVPLGIRKIRQIMDGDDGRGLQPSRH